MDDPTSLPTAMEGTLPPADAIALPVSDLKDRHRGEDAWVIAAGPSMQYVDPGFLTGRLTIGVNYAYRRFPCRYVVGKELEADAFLPESHTLVVSKHRFGNLSRELSRYPGPGQFYIFEHAMNRRRRIDWTVIGTDKLVVSYSTITSAIHLAAYMGAANILLCGTDGGKLDGRIVYEGYYADMPDAQFNWYRGFVQEIMSHTRELRDRLRAAYGCRVYALNPFIGFDLEGHHFEP